MSRRGSPFCDLRAGRVASLPEWALLHGAAAGDVAAQATPVSVDHDTPAMLQHDRTAEPATMAISSEQDPSPPVCTPADARAAPVPQGSGPRIDLAQSGCDEAGVERHGFAVDGAQPELISRIFGGEFHFSGCAMGELGLAGPEPRLLRGLLAQRESMQLTESWRQPFWHASSLRNIK